MNVGRSRISSKGERVISAQGARTEWRVEAGACSERSVVEDLELVLILCKEPSGSCCGIPRRGHMISLLFGGGLAVDREVAIRWGVVWGFADEVEEETAEDRCKRGPFKV